MSQLKVDLPPEVSADEARVLLAMKLFETGRLSLGQAAKMADYSKQGFLEILAKAGIPVFDYPASELKDEIGV